MRYRINHFNLSEFRCPDCGETKVSTSLVCWLDILRSVIGVPLIVTSGYRCAKHNEEVGGSRSSRHLIGCAADILPPKEYRYDSVYGVIKRLTDPMGGWELKPYASQTHLHIGCPRAEADALWSGKKEIRL